MIIGYVYFIFVQFLPFAISLHYLTYHVSAGIFPQPSPSQATPVTEVKGNSKLALWGS